MQNMRGSGTGVDRQLPNASNLNIYFKYLRYVCKYLDLICVSAFLLEKLAKASDHMCGRCPRDVNNK